MEQPIYKEALGAFPFDSNILSVSPYGGGHINDTFLVHCEKTDYVLQRINRYVFPRPDRIMENMVGVTSLLRDKLTATGKDPLRGTLTVVKTTDGKDFFVDSNGDFWRVTLNIGNTTAHESAASLEMFRNAGKAFGDFQGMLADYPADTLHETIVNFHNTPDRYRQLREAIQNNKAGRLSLVEPELSFVQQREADCSLLTDLLDRGELPLKVTHNDTKMSNILVDNDTGEAVCVIDLDTVMPGLAAFDFGDSIRAGASTAAEDETDLTKVHFSMELFRAYTDGFLEACSGSLTKQEILTLPIGAKLMTFEVGIRFLTDYLNGDVYFKTAYPQHNLDRARNQLHLVREMEEHWDEMMEVVRAYA